MEVSEQSKDDQFEGDEDYSESGGSDPDSDEDPSYSILEETHAKFSNLSIKKKKSKARIAEDMNMGSKGDPHEVGVVAPELDEEDVKSFDKVQKIIEDGQLEKLKVDQCKVYLRKNGLRLTGNKDTLIQRIKEHREIVNGGEKKYPVSSFVLNCKGDACTGDVVMFEQNVYEMFNIASRSASGPPCGTRIVAGRIVKESYGAAKQQHTFTIEVLWSKGEKPLPPLHPLLIKGRNLYRLKTLRQRWEDERERQKVLMDKHSRGSFARSDREARIQEKELRKVLKATRISRKEESNRNHSQFNSSSADAIEPLQSGKPAVSQQQLGVSISGKLAMRYQQPGLFGDLGKPTMQAQPADLSLEPRQAAIRRNYHHQSSQNTVECRRGSNTERLYSGCQEVPHLRGNEFHAHYKRPNFHHNDHRVPVNKYPNIHATRGSSDRIYHRQPLANMKFFPPTNPLPRHGHTQPQLCRYYAQGRRCHFGDNCKFAHESRRIFQ
ncbi:zinc finger CCCH domain-containing protein 62-like isoform X2 [Alnus glutinosa]|uniref:zinc finger CCCH domain-containing protein 62-like isoform X2 n=1 Tax=Alnus glutinosa TaxID=3517 RepID=UPI002D78E511|nr:zinc finger CCCH domain-containing protein 62-like isoform X2 [Alnus glutinosa]